MRRSDKLRFILLRMFLHLVRSGLTRSAAELAFYLLFSIFPMIMVLHSLLAMIPIPLDSVMRFAEVLPDGVRSILLGYMDHLQKTPFVKPFFAGITLTLCFLSRVVRSIMNTFGDIYGRAVPKRPVRRIFVSLGMTMLCLLMLISSLMLLFFSGKALNVLSKNFPHTSDAVFLWEFIGSITTVFFLLVFLLICYRLLPGIAMRWRDAVPGAVTALFCWYALTRGFAWYVDQMAEYSILYGSIAAVIVLMIWLNFSALTLILGAVLNYVLQIDLKEEEIRLNNQAVVNKEDIT